MKNKEKFANELINFALSEVSFGIRDKDGKPVACDYLECNECKRSNARRCKDLTEWAEQEYIEIPKVDWSKVPVDTPIYVRDYEDADFIPRYFAKYEDGKVSTWMDGKTSFTSKNETEWKYAKLAEQQKTDDERVVEAAKTIKEYCKNNKNCSSCVLLGDAICSLDGQPDEWEV